MSALKTEVGKRYGKLVVLTREPDRAYPGGQTQTVWGCKCDCGASAIVPALRLRQGQKSCGCLRGVKLSEEERYARNTQPRACAKCGEVKSSDNFALRKGLRVLVCKTCRVKESRAHAVKNPASRISRELKYAFGMSLVEFQTRAHMQANKCAICGELPVGKKKRLSVDHCHSSGVIRGLLCNSCNLGLGLFKDNIQCLRQAVNYLEEHARNS